MVLSNLAGFVGSMLAPCCRLVAISPNLAQNTCLGQQKDFPRHKIFALGIANTVPHTRNVQRPNMDYQHHQHHNPNPASPLLTCSPAHLFCCSAAHLLTCSPAHLLTCSPAQTGFHPSWSTFLWYCNVSKKTRVLKYW